jgi:hypothetical protein
MEYFINNEVRVNTINTVIDYYFYIKELGYNVIVVTDIDDTVLSTKIGQKLVEKNIKILIEDVYKSNPDNLVFLTARDYEYKRFTNNQLNRAKLHTKTTYVTYNLLMSPDDYIGKPTKGETFLKYFVNGKGSSLLSEPNKQYILFIDDLHEQIESVKEVINNLNINYTLFHYKFV